ncbi:Oxidoreductase, short-chain dehydrogenase/reductase [Thermus sp. CCB_US3_UF1]|uniref:SDR family NAD(P)-dependent oxidoreductase n=1 Tax=Thermus sp. CCB_US3_UF1 TaxID=1111069 RepID=UPI0002389D86|nr:SDR family oxidoreductase [Thermus sp. CCB_US3_UF1]AEV15470.1 Oxidoreductase, short-chain dehydrogenase/reductase [Thermus sp. CCB_US3_UF1]
MLQGKAFLVTGAGGALARAVIPALHRAGARLFLSDPRPERMAERAQGVGAETFVADLTRLEEAEALARFVERQAPLHGVVHTVGGFAAGRFLDSDPGLYDWMLDLNLRTTYNLLRAVLPYMERRGEGFFAAIAAGPAWTGSGPGRVLYTVAKTALASLLRSLQGEVEGVRFLVVYPMGTLDTEANRRAMPEADPSRWIAPEFLAEAIVLAASARGGRLLELPIYPPT